MNRFCEAAFLLGILVVCSSCVSEKWDIAPTTRWRDGTDEEYNALFDLYTWERQYSMVRDWDLTEQLEKKLFQQLSENAKEGNARSQYYLGVCHLQGIGTSVNSYLGEQWIFVSATNEFPLAQYSHALSHSPGSFEYKEYLCRAIKNGSLAARQALANYYLFYDSPDQNWDKGLRLLQEGSKLDKSGVMSKYLDLVTSLNQ